MGIDIIVTIAIIWYIISRVKKKNEEETHGKNQGTSNSRTINMNQSVRTTQPSTRQNGVYQSRPAQNYQKNFAVMPEHKKVPPNVERDCRVEDNHRSEMNGSAKPVNKPSAVPNVQRAYTEAPKQTREQKKATRMVAKRLYEGDHVPKGHRMIKCSYCAAENLIAYSARGEYMCYFCHTDLK